MTTHHSHEMHHHLPARAEHERRLAFVLGLTTITLAAQILGAWLTGSLALLADAGHMLTDAGALGLTLVAIRFARRPATYAHSYGFYRAEILAALLNGAVLFAVSGYVLWEAVNRLREPPAVETEAMVGIAAIGLVVNLIGAAVLHAGARDSLAVEGAYLEVLADLLGSLGVIAAGLVMWATQWWYADPLVSLGIGVFIIPRTYRLVSRAVSILMEGAPAGLDIAAVERAIAADPDVEEIHDLHVWSISSGIPALSVHVVVRPDADGDALLDRLCARLAEQFGIDHTTIQIERQRRQERIYHQPQAPPASGTHGFGSDHHG